MSLMDAYELEIFEGGGDIVAIETATHLEVIEQEPAVTILQLVPDVLEVVVEGPQGPAGPAGSTPALFIQSTAAATWIINHNLGYFPDVKVMTNTFETMYPDIIHSSVNTVTIIFATPTTGYATTR